MGKLKYLSIADNVSISIPTGDTAKKLKSKTEPISQNCNWQNANLYNIFYKLQFFRFAVLYKVFLHIYFV